MPNTIPMHLLFAYGSLLEVSVQLSLFGKTLTKQGGALLEGWQKIASGDYPYIKPAPGHRAEGELLQLSDEELAIADRWEEIPQVYQREILHVLRPGSETIKVWAYTRR